MEYVYQAVYSYFIEESDSSSISVHKTEAGATKAIEEHKERERKKFLRLYPSDKYNEHRMKFGEMEYWGVSKMEILD